MDHRSGSYFLHLKTFISFPSSEKRMTVSINFHDLRELIELAERPFHICVDRALEELVQDEFKEI